MVPIRQNKSESSDTWNCSHGIVVDYLHLACLISSFAFFHLKHHMKNMNIWKIMKIKMNSGFGAEKVRDVFLLPRVLLKNVDTDFQTNQKKNNLLKLNHDCTPNQHWKLWGGSRFFLHTMLWESSLGCLPFIGPLNMSRAKGVVGNYVHRFLVKKLTYWTIE